MKVEERLIVALDTGSGEEALALVDRLGEGVSRYKVAVGLFTKAGPDLVRELARRKKKVFVDLKFHDIPTQVALACRAVVHLGAAMMNLHTTGGSEMMSAAAAAVRDESEKVGHEPPLLLGVTVLTSLSGLPEELGLGKGVTGEVKEMVLALAALADRSGLDGVVCSGREVEAVKAERGPDFVTVVPGIRPASADKGDQKRVLTPARAMAAGADYLVIGRPITGVADPAAALGEILEEMENA